MNLWYVHLDKELESAKESTENVAEVPEASSNLDGNTTPSMQWGVALLASWTVGKNDEIPILVGLTYESKTKTFHGELILADNPVLVDPRLPEYDHRLALPSDVLAAQGVDITQIPTEISLWVFFTDSGSPPTELRSIPFNLVAA